MDLQSCLAAGIHLAMGLPLAVALAAAVGWTCWVLAVRLLPLAPASVRLAGAISAAIWLCQASFFLLSLAGAFRPWCALALWCFAAALANQLAGRDALDQLRSDLRRAAAVVREVLGSRYRWIVLAALVLVSLRLLRGMEAPPLGWDSFKYHLVRAGRWVQDGGWGPIPVTPPDWAVYEYFFPNGDVLWAWALLPVSNDALLPLASALIWFGVVAVAYPLARMMGGTVVDSAITALMVGLTPAAANALTVGYVDNTTLLCFLVAVLFVGRALVGPARLECLLGAAAVGSACGTKALVLPAGAVGVAALMLALWRSDQSRGRRALLAAACVALVAIALPGPLHALLDKGSPLWPFAVKLAGRTIFAGDAEYMSLLVGPAQYPFFNLLALVVPNALQGVEHLNFGPAAFLVLWLGAQGVRRLPRTSPGRQLGLSLVVAALALAVPFLANARGELAYWPHVIGRFIMPAWASLLILSAPLQQHIARLARKWTLITDLALFIPLGWTLVDLEGMGLLALPVLVIGAAALGAARLARARQRTAAVVVAALCVPALAAPWGAIRAKQRYPVYQRAATLAAYDMHWLDKEFASAWPVWRGADGPRPEVVAVTAGHFPHGENCFRYPLLGSRLQNRLVYVSPLANDPAPSYRIQEQWRSRADYGSWLGRLRQAGVGLVAVMPPLNLEAQWMEEHPEAFERVASGENDAGLLYRLRAPAR